MLDHEGVQPPSTRGQRCRWMPQTRLGSTHPVDDRARLVRARAEERNSGGWGKPGCTRLQACVRVGGGRGCVGEGSVCVRNGWFAL